jgi:predicted ATP-dependent endonuclease of OLD family
MDTYRIEYFTVDNLWDYKDFDLRFDPDVNILIGPNASGKTTLLRLLHLTFSGDFRALREIDFDQIRIGLRSFDGESTRTVKIETTDSGFECSVARKKFSVDFEEDLPRPEFIRTSEGYVIEAPPRGRRRKRWIEASSGFIDLSVYDNNMI